jgi:dihydroflavonol-4-reductase
MRVLVTGGTGYLGSHIVGALRREGHDVRVLARSPDRIAPALEPLGLEPAEVEVAVGDVLDRASMDAAVDGADAMINAANVYSLDVCDAERVHQVNATGTSASPTGEPEGAYNVSKADSERIAFRLREQGAPVVVTNPSAIFGPYDPRGGENTRELASRVNGRSPLCASGSVPFVDVRDLGIAHARLVAVGAGRPRFLMTGRRTTLAERDAILRRVTGRRLPALPVPRVVLPVAARVADVAQRRGIDPGFSSTGNMPGLRRGGCRR